MHRQQREEQPGSFGVTMPVFFAIWLVCAIVAGISWQNLVDNTLIVGKMGISFPSMLVLSLGFGLPGAGLICMAIDIIRRP